VLFISLISAYQTILFILSILFVFAEVAMHLSPISTTLHAQTGLSKKVEDHLYVFKTPLLSSIESEHKRL
jgi:hypothetical protein